MGQEMVRNNFYAWKIASLTGRQKS